MNCLRSLFSNMILLLWILLSFLLDVTTSVYFSTTSLTFSGATTPGNPVDITITTQISQQILPNYRIGIVLPRFTQRLTQTNATYNNISTSSLLISPSTLYEAEWLEPDYVSNYNVNAFPYPNSVLLIKTKNNATILSSSSLTIKVYKENGIGPLCGFPSNTVQNASGNALTSTPDFRIVLVRPIVTPTTTVNEFYQPETSRVVDSYTGLGYGCAAMSSCSNAGVCDFCFQKCHCFPGHGASTDIFLLGAAPAIDCSTRVCPTGRAVVDLPTAPHVAHHRLAECANAGICNRQTGTCTCYPPFTGAACDRSKLQSNN